MPEINDYYHPALTLPELLKRAVRNHPDLYVGYCDKNGDISIQTYPELLAEAGRMATGLHHLGARQGDKVIIATKNNRETVGLLWGSFFLGLVPTILQPPVTFSGYNPSVVKLMKVYHQLGNPFVFMDPEIGTTGELPDGAVRFVRDLQVDGDFPVPALSPGDLAFIQFSSGSTGDPKGVMLTHQNLIVNMDSIRKGLDLQYPDRFGNWMPLFHDMGLIGYHLTPIYSGVFQYQIETVDFIMNPGLWLRLMGRHGITVTGCTNFGLALVLRHLGRKKPDSDWDFSPMKAMLNGAEPISVKIMLEVVEALKPFGYHPDAMMPVYGLAEATLAVTFAPLMQPSVVGCFHSEMLDRNGLAQPVAPDDPAVRILSEVGVALDDIGIRITDDHDQPVDEGHTGHIQLRGPSVTSGYFNNPSATAAVFCGDWLRTGDIGFFYGGRLFISGRYKDIIFKNGRNYFANDLESVAIEVDGIAQGKVCFGGTTSRETGQDKVIAFIAGVSDEKGMDTFLNLRGHLRSTLGITVDELILIRSNEIPKTSSGKLQRYKLIQRYLNGEFEGKIIREQRPEAG